MPVPLTALLKKVVPAYSVTGLTPIVRAHVCHAWRSAYIKLLLFTVQPLLWSE